MMEKRIWLITGISSGLGKALAETVMEHGDFVVGTFRKQSQVEEFNKMHEGKGLGLLADVTNTEEVQKIFEIITDKYGRLDVLVNNAGVGFVGAIEEASLAEARAIFEVNVFGALQVTQMALPTFRKQGFGHIFQISSGSDIKASAGFGIYNASKFALEGFSEALADEIKPLGIKMTIVEPGPFRTEFAGTSLMQAHNEIKEYEATAGAFRKKLTEVVHNHQEGHPRKAANIIMEVSNHENPPLRLPLGKIVLGGIEVKLASMQQDLDNWRDVSASAVY